MTHIYLALKFCYQNLLTAPDSKTRAEHHYWQSLARHLQANVFHIAQAVVGSVISLICTNKAARSKMSSFHKDEQVTIDKTMRICVNIHIIYVTCVY